MGYHSLAGLQRVTDPTSKATITGVVSVTYNIAPKPPSTMEVV
jgi:GMP synthase PP-ATPase subunit